MLLNQKRGRIALISVHGDPSIKIGKEEAGGQNVYVREIGKALAKIGWQVDMFTRKICPKQATVVKHKNNCRTIRLTAGPEKFIERDYIYTYLSNFVQSFLNFQESQNIQYPLVHTNYWLSGQVGIELCQKQSIKLIHTYHSLGAVKYKATKNKPLIATTRLQVEKQCLETADKVIATSPQEKEHMYSLVSKKGNIEIIPCGSDIERFGRINRNRARKELGIDNESKVILYVGRFDRRKGIETLVKAIATEQMLQYDKLKLIIVGGSRPGKADRKERNRIKAIVKQLNLENITTFAGLLEHEELSVYYSAANVVVIPSHYEPFGLVAIESMASRTPVVASNVGGLKYTVIPKKTGFLVPPQDEVAFAVAMTKILSNPGLAEQLGANGRARVEAEFSWDTIARKLDELYIKELASLYKEFFLTPKIGGDSYVVKNF